MTAFDELISTKWRRWREIRLQIEAGLEADLRKFRRAHPRADQPWQLAEDRRLLRLHDRYRDRYAGHRLWTRIAYDLGRTTAAVQTRFNAIRAGMRFARRCG